MLKGFVDGNSGEEEHYAPPCSKDAALVKIVMDIVLNEGCGDGCIDSHIRGRNERSLSGRAEWFECPYSKDGALVAILMGRSRRVTVQGLIRGVVSRVVKAMLVE